MKRNFITGIYDMEWVWVEYHYILEFTKLYVVYEQLKRQQGPRSRASNMLNMHWEAQVESIISLSQIWQAFSFLLVVLKAGSSCWKLHLKDPQENQEDVQ